MSTFKPRLAATTGDSFCRSIKDCDTVWSKRTRHRGRDDGGESNFFREAQFSEDGTTIVTHNEDQRLRAFVLPTGLLEQSNGPHNLNAYTSWPSSSNIQSYAIYPTYNLQDPSTTLVLSSSTGLPLSLRNGLDYDKLHATYRLVSLTTEEYLSARSLAFSQDGTHFIAGSNGLISVFDCSYDGHGPFQSHRASPKTKAQNFYGKQTSGCRGIVSALNLGPKGTLAAGSFHREIALYSNEGRGECMTAFSLPPTSIENQAVGGTGVTSLKWSPCGTFLLIAERQSDGVHVYDMRNTMQRVARLSGRNANTTQRLAIDLMPTADGYEIWAGGTDGCVRMWKNPGSREGLQGPDAEAKLHDDSISSAAWHPSGAVLATCSGQRFAESANDADSSDEEVQSGETSRESPSDLSASANYTMAGRCPDNRLKVWSFLKQGLRSDAGDGP